MSKRFFRSVTRMPVTRKEVFIGLVSIAFLIAYALTAAVAHEPLSSAETRFTEQSTSGLQIVAASCPSNPHTAGECTAGTTCTPNEWSSNGCTRCNAQGQWNAGCTDYGQPYDPGFSTSAWCTCNASCTGASYDACMGDVCPNIAGIQTTPPTGYEISAGQCVVSPDQCPNVAGVQTTVPANMFVVDGVCFDDLCPNLAGGQVTVPAGYAPDADGNCIASGTDACPNITGFQYAPPNGTIVDANGDCVPSDVDVCPNISGKQTSPPAGRYIDVAGNCSLIPANCPAGTTGTPPNCVSNTCPAGTTGTPPNCVSNTCPAGTTGTPPNCVGTTPPTTSCVSNQGATCTSSTNACGKSNSGTIQCDGSCSAHAPSNNSCTYTCWDGTVVTGSLANCPACPTGWTKVGNSCVPPPPPSFNSFRTVDGFNASGHLQVRPTLIRQGDKVKVYWNVNNVRDCRVTGTNGDSWNAKLSGTSGKTSSAITGRTTYTMFCRALVGATPSTITETAVVNVIPTWTEE